MNSKTYIDELDVCVIFKRDQVIYKDDNEYTIDRETVRMLKKSAGISEVESALILGKIEELRIEGSCYQRGFKKMDPAKLVWNLATILWEYNWREVFNTLQNSIYHQIKELCEAKNALEYYRREMP